MTNLYTLLKTYIVSSILWLVFMLNIIFVRLLNNENVNDVFGISLLDTALYIFGIITLCFILIVLHTYKIYFTKKGLFLV